MIFNVPSLYALLFSLSWLCTIPSTGISQERYWNKKYDLDGGNDWGGTIKVHGDQMIIAVNGFCEENNRNCAGLISVDTSGAVNWTTILYDSLTFNYLEAILLIADTVYANMNYRDIDSLQFTVVRIDTDTGGVMDRHDYFKETTLSGNYVARGITGYQDRFFVAFGVITDGSVPSRHFIRGYDLSWNTLLEVSIPNTYENPAWYDIQATPDGGVVAAYTAWQSSTGDRLGTIEKYDSSGAMEWQTNLPYLGDFEDWMRIDLHPDGGYVGFWWYDTFGLQINPQPNIVFKLDQEGDIEWQRVEDFYEMFELYDLFSARNGDLVACGTARYWPFGPPKGPKYEGAFLIRYNAEGERLWDRKILVDSSVYWRALYGGAELANGDLVFTGEICDTTFGIPDDPTPCNIWVIKVDSMGCFEQDCGEFQHITSRIDILEKDHRDIFAVYPNPASDEITIGARLGAYVPHGRYSMHLYDMYGNLSFSQEFDPLMIAYLDVSHYSAGMYYMTIIRNGRLVQIQKVNLIR
ncbi:MAG TPA: T9SS type A sorting domain-containing protein [Saprospiraceae bacterium]|nr:T9SS type A sorting domain-containing protein [Saprospiraceae bacterium]